METAIRTQRLSKIFTVSNGIVLISFLFVALFVSTGFDKLRNPLTFFASLNASPLLKPYASFLVYVVPLIEIFISLLLAFNPALGERKIPARKVALIASGVLMLLFTIYIVVMLSLYNTKGLFCSCGKVVSDLSWTGHIYFNLGFVLLAIVGLILYRKQPKPI